MVNKVSTAEAFDRALREWLRLTFRHRAHAHVERELRRTYQQAWREGSTKTRSDVLLYLASARLAEGKPLILAGLRSRSEKVRVYALNAADMYMIRGRWQPDSRTGAAIGRIVERDVNSRFRPLAFDVLRKIQGPAATATFARMAANDLDHGYRIEANMELLRRGHGEALSALFAEQRKHGQSVDCFPEAREVVERLGLPVSRGDQKRVDRLATKAIQHHRARLGDGSADEFERSVSARFLSLHCEPRDPLEDADVNAMGNLALKATRTDTVPVVTRALALIESRLARRWLRRLGGPPRR